MKRKLLFTAILLAFVIKGFSQNKDKNPSLKDTIKIGEVVVTGTRVGITKNNVPMSVSVINKDEIEQSGQSNILPIIQERVPGIFVTERGVAGFGVANNAAGKISIRGIGGNPNTQVLVLIDGHPQFAGIFGHPLPDAYVSSDIEKVEVIRGPASILYGSNAMGGVINIITKQQKEDGFHGDLNTMLGSYNTHKYVGSFGYKKNKFSVMASFNNENTDGDRRNSAFSIYNGYLNLGYEINNHFKINSNVSIAKYYAEDPGPKSTENTIPQTYNIDVMRGNAAITVENRFTKTQGMLTAFHNFGEHNLSDGFHSKDFNSGIMFYEGFKLIKNNTITLGIDYKTFGGKAENIKAMNGAGMVFGDKSINEAAAYVFVQQNLLKKLILNAGIRLENNSRFGNEYVPQFGFAYNHSNTLTIKGSASKGFRSPTIRELYLFAPTCNPDLKPERVWSYELGALKSFFNKKLQVELTGFIAEGNNLIQQAPPPKYINTGTFNNKGIEFGSNYAINKNLKAIVNYTWLTLKNPILSAPEHQLFVGWNYKYKKISFSANVKSVLGLYTRLENKQAGLSAIKGNYTTLNTKIMYAINKDFDVYVSGENLTDKKYEINYDYLMPGICIFGGVHFKF